ncbi:hypothetical protein E2R55_05080 [Vibrio vulnificus]|nr:hypothetical protein E2R55_05080 [Vibrio vulnificus]
MTSNGDTISIDTIKVNHKKETVHVQMFIETQCTKKEMHQWQHKKIVDYKKKNNKRPPWNKSDY